jgi:hypothetical protein
MYKEFELTFLCIGGIDGNSSEILEELKGTLLKLSEELKGTSPSWERKVGKISKCHTGKRQ